MKQADGFVVKLTVIDEWQGGSDKYRLVNLGAGPYQLQIYDNGKWGEGSECYKWSTVTYRIKQLRNSHTKEAQNTSDNTERLK